MKRFRTIGLVLVAVLAFSALVASAAQAVTAPYFTVGGTRLVAGKTHNIAAHGVKAFVLSTPEQGTTIKCESLEVVKGVLLGSNAGQPGKDNEINVFSKCTVTGLGTNCKVVEPIETNPLTSELIEIDGTTEPLGEEFKPTEGATFVKLKFSGSECKVAETAVTGKVVGQGLTDEGLTGKPIELGQEPKQATSWLVNFPAEPIGKILLVNTKGEKETVGGTSLTAFGDASTLEGVALVLLANTKFEPETAALWSPLP